MSGLAGLGLFLLGISMLEDGLRALAGRSFKRFLREHTNHPLKAIFAGILATVVLQSSSVVIVLLLALVGAGVIGLTSALGIVIGANLGTTFTGWVVTMVGFKFDVEAWVMPLVASGAFLFVFAERRYTRLASWGRILLGFGLLLLGLVMLKDAMAVVADQVDLVAYARYGTVPFALAGFVFTALIQSSSATMMITLAALNSGVLELSSAAALVIGADLGTTVTGILGGLGGSAVKKQVALGQFLFNLVTDVVALAAFPWLLATVVWLVGDDPLIALVLFHSSFNILGILIFLPFLGPFSRFLERRMRGVEELPPGFEALADVDPRFPTAAVLILEHATRNFLLETADINRRSLRMFQEAPGLRAQLIGGGSFADHYSDYKQLQGRITQTLLGLQRAGAEPDLVHQLAQVQDCLQNAGHSAKELRDVERDLRTMESSADREGESRLAALQQRASASYDELESLLQPIPPATRETNPEGPAFEALRRQLDDNRGAYEQRLAGIYGDTAARLTPAELIEAIHVNRELYDSTKRLIIAFRHALLDGEAAELFDGLPAR